MGSLDDNVDLLEDNDVLRLSLNYTKKYTY